MADYRLKLGYDRMRAKGYIGLDTIPDEETVSALMNGVEAWQEEGEWLRERAIGGYALEWFDKGIEVQIGPATPDEFDDFAFFVGQVLERANHTVTWVEDVIQLNPGVHLFQDN